LATALKKEKKIFDGGDVVVHVLGLLSIERIQESSQIRMTLF